MLGKLRIQVVEVELVESSIIHENLLVSASLGNRTGSAAPGSCFFLEIREASETLTIALLKKSGAHFWEQDLIGCLEVPISDVLEVGFLQDWMPLNHKQSSECGRAKLSLTFDPKSAETSAGITDARIVADGFSELEVQKMFHEQQQRCHDSHFVSRFLAFLESKQEETVLRKIGLRQSTQLPLAAVAGLAKLACPTVLQREMSHLNAFLAVRMRGRTSRAPFVELEELKQHLKLLRDARARYWGIRCSLTEELPPMGQPLDMTDTEVEQRQLGRHVRALVEALETKFEAVQADFSSFQPDKRDALDQLGVVSVLAFVHPEIPESVLCYMLVHLDEVIEEDGRVTVNELYTALKWWICMLPAPSDLPAAGQEGGGEAPAELVAGAGGSHVVDQLCKVLHHEGGAAVFEQFAADSAGGLSLDRVVELASKTCLCLRPRDQQHLRALLDTDNRANSSGRMFGLEELRETMASNQALKNLYWRMRCARTGEMSVHLRNDDTATPRGISSADMAAAMTVIGQQVESIQETVRACWDQAGPNKAGQLDQTGLRSVLNQCFPKLPRETTSFLLIHLDATCADSGLLRFEHLLSSLQWWNRQSIAADPQAHLSTKPESFEDHIFAIMLRAAESASTGAWPDFDSVDKDHDGSITAEELQELVNRVCPSATNKDVWLVRTMVDVDRFGVVTQPQLCLQFQTCLALRREYWKHRIAMSGELSPIPDLTIEGSTNGYVLALMKRVACELEANFGELCQFMLNLPSRDAHDRVGPMDVRASLLHVVPGLELMDLKLVLLHLNEATHEDGTVSAPELIMAIKWWSELEVALNSNTPEGSPAQLIGPSTQEQPQVADKLGAENRGAGLEDTNVLAVLLRALRQSDAERCFAAADKDNDGSIDVPEVGDLMGMLGVELNEECKRDLFYVAAMLDASTDRKFSFKELLLELCSCQAVRWMYWKQRCVVTGEDLPPLYTDFGCDYESVPVSEGIRSVLTVLEANYNRFMDLYNERCQLRGSQGTLDLADLQGLLGQLLPNIPKVIMRLVITHIDAAVRGDGAVGGQDVVDVLKWWVSAEAIALDTDASPAPSVVASGAHDVPNVDSPASNPPHYQQHAPPHPVGTSPLPSCARDPLLVSSHLSDESMERPV